MSLFLLFHVFLSCPHTSLSCLYFLSIFSLTSPSPSLFGVTGMVLWPVPMILSYSIMHRGLSNLSVKCLFKSDSNTHTHTYFRGLHNNSLMIESLVSCFFHIQTLTFYLNGSINSLLCLPAKVSFSVFVLHKHGPISTVSSSYNDSYSLVSLCITEPQAAHIKTPSTGFSLPGDHC